MSDDLKNVLLEYIDEMQTKIRREYFVKLLDSLSPTLRGRVSVHMYGEALSRVPFFDCDDERERKSFTTAVACQLKVDIFGREETVYPAGASCDKLCIIYKGIVAQSDGEVLTGPHCSHAPSCTRHRSYSRL